MWTKPWRVVPKEVGAPAGGIEARAWREGPDAPARRPRSRYLGTGSQHATAAVSIIAQRPRVEVAGWSLVPCARIPLWSREFAVTTLAARSWRVPVWDSDSL